MPSEPAGALYSGTVELVEKLGADSLVHIADGGVMIVARVPHGVNPAPGTPMHVAADPAHIYLFVAETGARMT